MIDLSVCLLCAQHRRRLGWSLLGFRWLLTRSACRINPGPTQDLTMAGGLGTLAAAVSISQTVHFDVHS